MELVEFDRYRRWLFWLPGLLLVFAIVGAAALSHTEIINQGSQQNVRVVVSHTRSDLDGLAIVAAFIAMVFATANGLSLCRESETVALSWTKPISRTGVALRIFAVDVAMLAIVYVFAWAVALGFLGFLHTQYMNAERLPVAIVLTFGIVLMWYGLMQVITAGLNPSARAVVGFAWPVALLLTAVKGQFGGTLNALVSAVNVINPLAYTDTNVSNTSTLESAFWTYPIELRALMVWVMALAFLAIASAIWIRREV
jgi:hypothetical protein